jgi:hypothetical protein
MCHGTLDASAVLIGGLCPAASVTSGVAVGAGCNNILWGRLAAVLLCNNVLGRAAQ